MATINNIRISVNNCQEGIYLRWWFNGWHYFLFTNGYETNMQTKVFDLQTTNFFSVISKVERPTRIKSEYSYVVELHGITIGDIEGFKSLLLAEYVEQYEEGIWREVTITRGDHLIRYAGDNGYLITFEITRKELINTSSVYQKSLKLYVGDTLCDMDDDEIVPINKQVNNIAELQDRQSDFTATFRIRKTRAMRELFELSGEVGATTDIPYQRLSCKLIQDNIEVITGGYLVLDRVDDQYYYVSIISGNLNFFNVIAGLKITDLLLTDCNHTWDVDTMVATHGITSPAPDICYPLLEPSNDGSIAPLTDDGDRVEMYGGWVWCFVKVKRIWEEIFTNAGFTVTGGDIIDSDLFDKLYLPIVKRTITDVTKYQYWSYWSGNITLTVTSLLGIPLFLGVTVVNGDATFGNGGYVAPYTATYKYSVRLVLGGFLPTPPTLYLTEGIIPIIVETFTYIGASVFTYLYEVEHAATAGDLLSVYCTAANILYFSIQITDIQDAQIAYSSFVEPRLYLPDMSQTDFIKMVCNLLGLVPDVTPRDRKIRFWNYSELYDNFAIARDWSAYLSERDDEVEFKFGDYAQHNYLTYKQSDDVLVDTGKGDMQINDETLPETKDVVQLIVSTCDEVTILNNVFSVDVSRIDFNVWNDDTAEYDASDDIDARIVYIDHCREDASPLYQKAFWIRPTVAPLAGLFAAPSQEILTPKVAQSFEISFSNLVFYYASLSRMLTKTKVRRVKFNLPVYEVANLKHNIPIYLQQYKAYFYVNKISNYVAGRLCTVELIRL